MEVTGLTSTMSHSGQCEDREALLSAVSKNDIDAVQLWLKTKPSPNFVYNEQSPICHAAASGFEDIVDLLIQYRCDPLQPDISDHMWFRRPIHMAASKGHLGVVKRLINRGVDINSRDSDNRTALHWVCTYGHIEIVEYLLAAGACVNMAQIDGFTPLHAATCLGHEDVCTILLANGADPNQADRDGWTALHTAVCYGYEGVVRILLDWRAKVDQTTIDVETCFHIAVSSGHLDIVKMLYQHGVDVDKVNINGYTAFHLSIYYNKQDIAQFLIQNNVTMCTENFADQTPLYLAAMRGEVNLILMMIEGGYNLAEEYWLKYDRIPTAIKDTRIADILLYLAHNPRSLREIACACVRNNLKGDISESVKDLPLPITLKELLCFKTFTLDCDL